MLTIYNHEMKSNLKALLIWVACVGGLGLACILLYSTMEADMAKMAEGFADMGPFADAFGMSQLSLATLIGFYATEIGTTHSLGGAMFAAITAAVMLSKEEDGHTSEFLFSLPVSRPKVVFAKWCAVVSTVILFNVICVVIYCVGFGILGEDIPVKEYVMFHGMQLLMQIEISAICFAMSAFVKKNKLGIGLGIVMLLYAYDLMVRVIPDLQDYKIICPFAYANASDIISTGEITISAVIFGCVVLVVSVIAAFEVYVKRDLAA